MARNFDEEIAQLEAALKNSPNDGAKQQALEAVRHAKAVSDKRSSLRDEAMKAEGDMYAGTDNAGAMRRGEEARSALRGVSAASQSTGGFPSDFPIGFIPQLREMMRRQSGDMKLNPDTPAMVAFYQENKDRIQLNPSQEKFQDPKEYTIPGGVGRLGAQK
jgi:hypothetical protein